jgi:DNA polymerase I
VNPVNDQNQLKAEHDYFLLSTVYDAPTNSAGIKLYSAKNRELVYITDPYGHEPYCYSQETIEDIESIHFPKGTVKRFNLIKKRDLLNDRQVDLTQIVTPTPSEVPKVREILEQAAGKKGIIGDTWESRIKYHQNWLFDTELVPGRKYWWDPNQNILVPSNMKILHTKSQIFQL